MFATVLFPELREGEDKLSPYIGLMKMKNSLLLNLLVVIVSFLSGFYIMDVDSFLAGTTNPPQIGFGWALITFVMALLGILVAYKDVSSKPDAPFGRKNLRFMFTASLVGLSVGVAWTAKTLIRHHPFTIELFLVAANLGILCGVSASSKFSKHN